MKSDAEHDLMGRKYRPLRIFERGSKAWYMRVMVYHDKPPMTEPIVVTVWGEASDGSVRVSTEKNEFKTVSKRSLWEINA